VTIFPTLFGPILGWRQRNCLRLLLVER